MNTLACAACGAAADKTGVFVVGSAARQRLTAKQARIALMVMLFRGRREACPVVWTVEADIRITLPLLAVPVITVFCLTVCDVSVALTPD